MVNIYAARYGVGGGAVVLGCTSNVGAFSEEHERVLGQVAVARALQIPDATLVSQLNCVQRAVLASAR